MVEVQFSPLLSQVSVKVKVSVPPALAAWAPPSRRAAPNSRTAPLAGRLGRMRGWGRCTRAGTTAGEAGSARRPKRQCRSRAIMVVALSIRERVARRGEKKAVPIMTRRPSICQTVRRITVCRITVCRKMDVPELGRSHRTRRMLQPTPSPCTIPGTRSRPAAIRSKPPGRKGLCMAGMVMSHPPIMHYGLPVPPEGQTRAGLQHIVMCCVNPSLGRSGARAQWRIRPQAGPQTGLAGRASVAQWPGAAEGVSLYLSRPFQTKPNARLPPHSLRHRRLSPHPSRRRAVRGQDPLRARARSRPAPVAERGCRIAVGELQLRSRRRGEARRSCRFAGRTGCQRGRRRAARWPPGAATNGP